MDSGRFFAKMGGLEKRITTVFLDLHSYRFISHFVLFCFVHLLLQVVSGATTRHPAESQWSSAVPGNANPTREECTGVDNYWDPNKEICAVCVLCPGGWGSTAVSI